MKLKLYVLLTLAAGAAGLVYTLPHLPTQQVLPLAVLAVLGAFAQRMSIPLFSATSVSLAVAFAFTGLLLFGPAAAIVVNVPAVLVHAVYPKRRPLYKVAFNLALAIICAVVAGLVYTAAGGQFSPPSYPANLLPAALSILCYFFLQSAGVSVAIVLSDGGSFTKTWDSNYRWLILTYLAIGAISLGMTVAYNVSGPLEMLSYGLPLIMVWYSLRLYVSRSKEVTARGSQLELISRKLEESFLNTIRALSAAVDTKDHYTHDHSLEAMRYAAATARRMGLDPVSIAAVEVGAMFHDIGKIGIPEAILHKAGPLTDEEWHVMRGHPVMGARVVKQVSSLADVVSAVLHHHERFDGHGYPEKLSGAQIPLTAQIVAVVDAYQAMTSDRPYRQTRPHEYAVKELRSHAGTQFNPAVVEAFIAAREETLRGGFEAPQVDLAILLRAQRAAPALAAS